MKLKLNSVEDMVNKMKAMNIRTVFYDVDVQMRATPVKTADGKDAQMYMGNASMIITAVDKVPDAKLLLYLVVPLGSQQISSEQDYAKYKEDCLRKAEDEVEPIGKLVPYSVEIVNGVVEL